MDSSEELNSLVRTQAYINGTWVNATSGATFEVINPANGNVVASVADMDASDARKAIDAAHAAWPAFRDMTARERAGLLKNGMRS